MLNNRIPYRFLSAVLLFLPLVIAAPVHGEALPREGKVIVVISSDTPELIAVCDRVGVMRDGRLVTILEGASITEANILRHSMGVEDEHESAEIRRRDSAEIPRREKD